MVLFLAAVSVFPACNARAGFATQGQGIQPVLRGTAPNAALFMETRAVWINAATPPKPYVVDTWFALPACDAIPASRLVLTIWGGTAGYICSLTVRINGANLPSAAPLTFGGAADSNPVFSATVPSVYGSGSGVWLAGLPVPGGMLFRDGASNHVEITVNSPDSFDGRINQATLIAVRQAASLNNTLDYVLAEGSGDIYRAPVSPQSDARVFPMGPATHVGATAARLQVLYTYGDTGQNDRLFFNGVQLGGDDLAGWDKTASGQDYGPAVAGFDVLSSLAASNTVRFTVSSVDVPGARETSLRPQLAVLSVTRPPAAPALAAALNVVITWPVSSDAFQLEFRPRADTGSWAPVTNTPVVINGQNTVILPRATAQQFYQLRKN